MLELKISTTEREQMLDMGGALRTLVREQGWQDGALLVYCPHTTGAVTVNEGADPDVVRDILVSLRKLIPHRGDYRHTEGNSDAHIKTSTFGPDQMLIVSGGEIMLGTWQRVFFCEFDGPRSRTLWVQFLPA